MNDYKKYLVILFLLSLLVFPLAGITQNNQLSGAGNSYTQSFLNTSPDAYEVNNGTVLFTGALNTTSPEGKKFALEHGVIAQQTIQLIDSLTSNLFKTRQLNKQFSDNLGVQLNYWKQISNQNPALKPILTRELQVFNSGMKLQLEENTKWAVIDATLAKIKAIKDNKPVNESFTKTTLYTDLLAAEIDLIEFYKTKYKDIITLATLSHATQENPNIKLPQQVLDQIKPMHAKELELAKVLILDLDSNIKYINELSAKSKEFDQLYHQIDKYSLVEVNKVIKNLQTQADSLKVNQNNMLSNANLQPVLNGYLNYYKNVKTQLEDKVVAYEMREATLIAAQTSDTIKLAYNGIINPSVLFTEAKKDSWTTTLWNGVVKGTKVVSGAAFATTDYLTSKSAETLFTITDKASAMYNKGIFSNEYNTWANAYNQAGDKNSMATLHNTFVDPFYATIKGDDKNGLGQRAVNTAQSSFNQFDSYAAGQTGSKFVSQVLLNVATVGAYGLSKDLTTVNDANASTGDKLAATTGILLNFVPVLSGSKAVNQGARGSANTLKNSVTEAAENISKLNAKFNTAESNVKESLQELINAYGSRDVINAANKYTASSRVLGEVRTEVSSQTMSNILNVPSQTFTGGIKSAASGFAQDHTLQQITRRFQDLYVNSIRDVIKNSEPYFGQTLGNALGIKDLANFTLTSTVNESLENVIQDTVKGVYNYVNPQIPSQPGVPPVNSGYAPPQTNPALLQEYLGTMNQQNYQQNQQNTNMNSGSLDQLINQVNQNNQNLNNSRGVGNQNPNTYYQNPNTFSTNPNAGSSGNFVNNLMNQSIQSGTWGKPNQPVSGPCTTPCTPSTNSTPQPVIPTYVPTPAPSVNSPCTTPCT